MADSNKRRRVEQTVIVKSLKDINKRMEDFENAVETLKAIKDTVADLDCELAEKKHEHSAKLNALEREFADNKLSLLNRLANDLNRQVLSNEECEERDEEIERLKAQKQSLSTKLLTDNKDQVASLVEQRLKLQQLQHSVEIAELKASTTTKDKEIQHLKESIERFTHELLSQKEMTSQIACARNGSNNNSSKD
jgi:chromosome segregation ATPase